MRSLRRACLALILLAFPAAASAAMPSDSELAHGLMVERHTEHVASVDVRLATPPVVAPAAAQAARARLARDLGRFAAISVDRTTGTARVISRTDGFLSAPRSGTAQAV